MIVVKIKAGLGNQMFQYALGRRLSLDWNDELKFDLSWFQNIKNSETPRTLDIDKFKINLVEVTDQEREQVMPCFFSKIINKIRARLDRNYFYHFHSGLLKKKNNVYLDGYFQSYKYPDSIRKTLLDDFVLKNGYSQDAQKTKNDIELSGESVAVHVRRGDYSSSCKNWNGLCDIKYYQQGLDQIKKKYSSVKLFIFSDDIAWARENLKFDSPMVFVSRPTLSNAEELLLMSLCKHQIIANSTFSWWGAWLNQNPQKIVVAPSRWLLVSNIDTSELLPSEWTTI
ncbi:MAG: alpha-1,2-fucosyltransferase [Candidatus Magasanikbacteria bacterium]